MIANDAVLKVRDNKDILDYRFEDLIRYHGRGSIGGVAHVFKVLERALPLLAPDGPPDRYGITILTAFPGPGVRDGFELVTRAVTGGRYTVDLECAPQGTIEAPHGHYYFRLSYDDRVAELTVRPGIVAQEFVDLIRKGADGPGERERLDWLKLDMAERIMGMRADAVYDAR